MVFIIGTTQKMEYSTSKFNYNPFAGVDKEHIEDVIVPQFDIQAIVEKIRRKEDLIIELVGKQGRGKTMHLTYLQQHVPEFPIYYLTAETNYYSQILNDAAEIVFIDSIHHLNLFQRNNIFKTKKIVIFTTHYRRKHEYLLAGKSSLTIKFRGINKKILKQLVLKRLQQASTEDSNITVSDTELEHLISKYNDNYRGIMNSLYDKYQSYE